MGSKESKKNKKYENIKNIWVSRAGCVAGDSEASPGAGKPVIENNEKLYFDQFSFLQL
jgi:hypothetical protein